MHSPLPDSSALESGILEDTRPTRLSRVQDNVRNLLRNSTLVGSIRSSPPSTPTRLPGHNHGLGAAPPTPPETPTRTPLHHHQQRSEPEVLPSPTESLPSTASPTSSTSSAHLHPQDEESPNSLFPPPAYLSPLVARMSKILGRAPAQAEAIDHPDVSEVDVEALARQKAEKRQRRAWKRKRVAESGRRGRGAGGGGTQCLLCVIAALMLASIVATCKFLDSTFGLDKRELTVVPRFDRGDDFIEYHHDLPRPFHPRYHPGHDRLRAYPHSTASHIRQFPPRPTSSYSPGSQTAPSSSSSPPRAERR